MRRAAPCDGGHYCANHHFCHHSLMENSEPSLPAWATPKAPDPYHPPCPPNVDVCSPPLGGAVPKENVAATFASDTRHRGQLVTFGTTLIGGGLGRKRSPRPRLSFPRVTETRHPRPDLDRYVRDAGQPGRAMRRVCASLGPQRGDGAGGVHSDRILLPRRIVRGEG